MPIFSKISYPSAAVVPQRLGALLVAVPNLSPQPCSNRPFYPILCGTAVGGVGYGGGGQVGMMNGSIARPRPRHPRLLVRLQRPNHRGLGSSLVPRRGVGVGNVGRVVNRTTLQSHL